MCKKLLLFLILLLFTAARSTQGCLQIDVLLVADMSQSVEGHEHWVATAFNQFVSKFELEEDGIKIGAVIFNRKAWILAHLTADKKEIGGNIDLLERSVAKDNTNMLSALYLCIQEFNANGRQGVKKVIVMVSDGATQDADDVYLAAGQLKLIGIEICGVVIIDRDSNEDFMELISSPGCYLESDYEQLPEKLKKMDVCL